MKIKLELEITLNNNETFTETELEDFGNEVAYFLPSVIFTENYDFIIKETKCTTIKQI